MSDLLLDPIRVEILWNRFKGIVDEQATVLMRTAFTNILSDAGDLAAGVFDAQGRMIAQAMVGTPGHVNTMATGMKHFLDAYPAESLQPGDVLICNDSHKFSGHLNDLTVATPAFADGKLVGYLASCCHALDIGGIGFGPEGRNRFEEGLYIPMLKFMEAGEPNHDLHSIIRGNVRTPEEVMGDLHAQVTANGVGARRLVELMSEFELDELAPIADEIISRTETAMRKAISDLPDGAYENVLVCDGWDDPIEIKCQVRIKGDEVEIDFTGTADEAKFGINVPLSYATAYATYGLKIVICPDVPNNEGSFRPIRVIAPEGCLLNCSLNAPVAAKHMMGHFASECVTLSLGDLVPKRAIAEGANTVWNIQAGGQWSGGKPFMLVSMMAGGMGARSSSDGLSAVTFPSGTKGTAVEIVETLSPLVIKKKELRIDSGGAGKHRGGLGQDVHLGIRSDADWTFTSMFDRIDIPPKGKLGGQPGMGGHAELDDGTPFAPKGKYSIHQDRTLIMQIPGGGGFGNPLERDPEKVCKDVRDGTVSLENAREAYGVVLSDDATQVDVPATEHARAEMSGAA